MTDLIAPGSDQFAALFRSFNSSAYRLETLQSYGSSGEDSAYAAFLAGQPYVRPPGKVAWLRSVGAAVAAGRTMSRVHVVREPLSDYMRFELTWAYAPNVAAGEDIRIVTVPEGSTWPADLPDGLDYWLFDDRRLYAMHYAADVEGTFLGVELVEDDWKVAQARVWRNIAFDLAVPWSDYIAARPVLAARLPLAS